MSRKTFFTVGCLLIASVVLSGCTISLKNPASSSTKKVDGSVWRSADSGKTWIPITKLATTGDKPMSITGVSVHDMQFDPQDNNAIYLATAAHGIVYTYDGGASWRQFAQLNKGRVQALAVDPSNKCILYGIVGNSLHKSQDCGRVWDVVYFHQTQEALLTDVVIDADLPESVYITTTEGEVMKSLNGGQTWDTIFRIKQPFTDIVIDAFDSRIVYAGSQEGGVFVSRDAGQAWVDLGPGIKSYAGSHQYQQLVVDPSTSGGLILVSKFGVLRTVDSGGRWSIVELLPGPKTANIYGLAIDPQDSSKLYYTTRTALVRTANGGQTWASEKLPSGRVATEILIHPERSEVLYLGMTLPK